MVWGTKVITSTFGTALLWPAVTATGSNSLKRYGFGKCNDWAQDLDRRRRALPVAPNRCLQRGSDSWPHPAPRLYWREVYNRTQERPRAYGPPRARSAPTMPSSDLAAAAPLYKRQRRLGRAANWK